MKLINCKTKINTKIKAKFSADQRYRKLHDILRPVHIIKCIYNVKCIFLNNIFGKFKQ